MDQEGMNYYKSLVSDNEVIEALIKESKAREGELEKTRIRPNLNFLQRTVSNMVSSNKRLSTKQEQIVAKEKQRNINYRPRRVAARQKLPIQLIQEILSSKIHFVKSSDKSERVEQKTTETKEKSPMNRKKKTPFQQMREILTNQVQSVKGEKTKSVGRKVDLCSSTDTSEESCSSKHGINSKDIVEDMKFTKRKRRKHSKNTSDATVIDLSDSTSDSSDVIRISDSDSSHSDDLKKCRRRKKKLKYRKI